MAPYRAGIPPLTAQELHALPVGVQPELPGLLACLVCGSWYRGLGQHVYRAHELRADQYRDAYQLPRSRALWPQATRAAAAARGRARHARDPERLRATQFRGTAAESARARAAQRDSAARAGTAVASQRRAEQMRSAAAAAAATRYAALAHTLGYDGLDALRAAVEGSTIRQLADALGLSPSAAKRLRAYVRTGTLARTGPPRRRPLDAAQLAALAPGVQPVDRELGLLVCRLCGHWRRELGRHLAAAHHTCSQRYRERFKLGPQRLRCEP